MIGYRQIQQHYIQQNKGKSFKCIILHANGTQQPLGAALGRYVTLKYEAATYLYVYNLWFYSKGMHPDFKAMHFLLDFKCSSS